MEFGKLTTPEAMEKYFQEMRQVSRTELLAKLYQTDPKPHFPEDQIENNIVQAFLTIMDNYNFDDTSPIVKEILH